MACATFDNAIFEEVRSLGGLVDEGEGIEGFELRMGGGGCYPVQRIVEASSVKRKGRIKRPSARMKGGKLVLPLIVRAQLLVKDVCRLSVILFRNL